MSEQTQNDRMEEMLGDLLSSAEDEETSSDIADTEHLPDNLPVLPLKETVVFPDTMMPLAVGQPRSVRLIDDVLARDRIMAVVAVKTEDVEVPTPADCYAVGTLVSVQKMIKAPDGTLRIVVQGIRRLFVSEYVAEEPFLMARVEELPDVLEEGKELEALQRNLVSIFLQIVKLVPYLPEELQMAAVNIEDPATLGYFIASTMRMKTAEKQELLEEVDVAKRLRRLTGILNRELEVLELGTKIQSQVQSEIDKNQREYFLRQQLKTFRTSCETSTRPRPR